MKKKFCYKLLLICLFSPILNANSDEQREGPDCSRYEFNSLDSGDLATPRLNLEKVDWNSEKDISSFSDCVSFLRPYKSETMVQTGGALEITEKAYVAMANKWHEDPDIGANTQGIGAGTNLLIDVCWANPTEDNLWARNLVQAAVRATWETHGNIHFNAGIPWGKCSFASNENSRGISIKFANIRPKSRNGNKSAKHFPSMHLTYEFNVEKMEQCLDRKKQCLWASAVHEFGHAIFFLHEHQREDLHWECKEYATRSGEIRPANPIDRPDTLGTSLDPFSMMNYCAKIYTERLQLSDCDIAALRASYGNPANNFTNYQPKCQVQTSVR